tara:strand:- start:81 stop:329 length:249 start_codon:yes stop_codon:yes gene_type:complete
MTYYILGKGEPLEHLAYSTNILGEESFGYFYWEDGYKAMLNIINSSEQKIDDFNIFDEKGTPYTLEEFTEIVTKLKMRTKNT